MSEAQKWYVNLYGSNQGKVYVGPLGHVVGVAEVNTICGMDQALKDAQLIVDAVNDLQTLRDERDRLLVVAAKFIKLAEWCAGLGWREFYYDDTTGLDGIIDLSDTFNPKLHADIELLRAALTPAGGGKNEHK